MITPKKENRKYYFRSYALVCLVLFMNLLIAFGQPQMLYSQNKKNFCINTKVGLVDDVGLAVDAFLKNPMGIVVDVNDAIYIADTNHHRIRRILYNEIQTIAGTGIAGYDFDNIPAISAAIYYPTDVAIDSHGNIYIVEHKGHRIRKIDTDGIISTYAGTGKPGDDGDRGLATAARLNCPTGISIDFLDNLYIADTMNHKIRLVDSNKTIYTFAGTGTPDNSGDGGKAIDAELNMPNGVYADDSGNIWIADTGNNLIRKVDRYRKINTVAGDGDLTSGPAKNLKLYQPTRVTLDGSGNLYISETGKSRIIKVPDGDPNRTTVVFAGGGNYQSYSDRIATDAELSEQNGIAFDRNNTLYIADTNNHFCSKVYPSIDETGNIEIIAGTVNPFPRSITSTSLNSPTDIIRDNVGAYYISDTDNHMILKIIKDVIYRFGGTGEPSRIDNCGNGSTVLNARFNQPKNLLFQSRIDRLTYEYSEYLYIAEPNLHWIRRVELTENGNIIETFAGTGKTSGTTFPIDATSPKNADLNYPLGMHADNYGDIYFADRDYNCIFKIEFDPYSNSSAIHRFVGSQNAGNSPTGTPALDAQLNKPVDVWIDSSERIYFIDSGNKRVCRVDKNGDTYIITEVVSNLDKPLGITGYLDKKDKKEYMLITDISKNNIFEIDLDDFPCDANKYNIVAGIDPSDGGFSGDGGPALQAELNAPSGISMNIAGDILFADSANNRIRKLSGKSDDPRNKIRTIAGFFDPAGLAIDVAIREASGVVTDPDGNVYYSDSKNHRVLKINNGNIEPFAGNGTAGYSGDDELATSAQLNSPQGLEYANGKLYIADKGNHSVRKVENGVITTILGNGKIGIGASNIFDSCLDSPVDVAIKGNELYVSDSNNHRIIRHFLGDNYFSVYIGNGEPGLLASPTGTKKNEAQLNTPAGISFDNNGVLLISEMGHHRVIKIEDDKIKIVAGTGKTFLNHEPYPTNYNLHSPSDVIVDSNNYIYISDTGHNMILKIANNIISIFAGNQSDVCNTADGLPRKEISINKPSSIFIHKNEMYIVDKCNRIGKTNIIIDNSIYQKVAGNGYSGFSGNNGSAISAFLDSPYDVAIDQWNNLYIADYKNHQIRKVTPDGIISTIAGTGQTVYNGDNDLAININLDSPHSVAVDLEGNVYIADTNHHLIRKIRKDDQKIINWVGTGYPGTPETNDDGIVPREVSLNLPHGIAIDISGNLYIADTGNKKVRIVEAEARVINIAQSPEVEYPYDVVVDIHSNVYVSDMKKHKVLLIQPGSNPTPYAGNGDIDYIYTEENQYAISASLYSPTFLDVDEESNLYIVDSGHHRIRKVYSDGKTIATIAGDGFQGFSGENNDPLFASINTPNGIAVEPGGNIILSDSGNHYIRKIFFKEYLGWNVNISDFCNKERIIAVVNMNGRNIARQGDKIAFFIDDVCRCVTYPVNTIKGERFFALIWGESNDKNKIISVKYYRKTTSEILTVQENLVYNPNSEVGTISDPLILNIPDSDKYPEIIVELKKTINEQAETINEQADTIDEQADTIDDQVDTIDDQADTIDDQAYTIDDQAYTITQLEFRVDQLSYYSVSLSKGWHLMSSLNDFNVTPETNPPGCIDVMYEYSIGRYEVVNELTPTRGFWVKLNKACELTVRAAQ